MPRRGPDAAISDTVGTLLLVLVVVLAGGGLTAVVAANLQSEPAPTASVSIAAVNEGDASVRIFLRSGESVALGDMRILLSRGSSGSSAEVDPSQWTTPDATLWRAGDTLTFPVSPTVSAAEAIRVQVIHVPANVQLANVGTIAPSTASPLDAPTLTAHITPSELVADASSAALLSVRVSHPMGALAVASLTANLTNISVAANSANMTLPLLDNGEDGDALGGDGNFSALFRAPANTTPGTYRIPLVARDVAGYDSAYTTVDVTITSNLTAFTPEVLEALGNLSILGNLTSLLANLTGQTPGVVVLNGTSAGEGTRLAVPTSENLSSFKIVNWTYERSDPSTLDADAAVVRVLGGSYAWSAYIEFDYYTFGGANAPAITRIEMWNGNSTTASGGRTVYTPSAGYVSLIGLELNMTHPTQNGFVCSGPCSPAMTYKNADIRGNPTFTIAWMRDESPNPDASDLGILSMEAIFE